jgi:hypothetical protein
MEIIIILVLSMLIVTLSDMIFCTNGEKRQGKEQFYGGPYIGEYTRIEHPTRNMSYDIRGEECYPQLLNLPFNNYELIHN